MSIDTPPYHWWSCFSSSCITDMELSSAEGQVIENTINIQILTEDLSVFSFCYWCLVFFVQWRQCSALYTLNLWLIDYHWLIVSLRARFANGEESWKTIQDPRKKPDCHQNQVNSSPSHAPPLHKISSKSVHNFSRYFAHRRNRTNT